MLEDALFASHDLTAQQYNILRLLRKRHPVRLPTLTLASRLISRAPDITRMLDKLEDRGLIQRERLPDNRRVVEVGITPVGLELLKTLDPLVQNCHERQLGHLTREQLTMLVELLERTRAPHEDPHSPWLPDVTPPAGDSAQAETPLSGAE